MESLCPQRSPRKERFVDLFTTPDLSPPVITADSTPGDELHEVEVLWTDRSESQKPPPLSIPVPITIPSASGFRRARPRPFDRSFGILAALPEDDICGSPSGAAFLQRVSTTSFSISPSSAIRMIPAIPKPKLEYSMSMPAYNQSAPVNVPIAAPRSRKGWGEVDLDGGGGEDDAEEDEMLPPHEIVARASHEESPMTTFSVLEGAGRTLKGRDLRRVRNAVFHRTGFID